jgi:hypothetical protein
VLVPKKKYTETNRLLLKVGDQIFYLSRPGQYIGRKILDIFVESPGRDVILKN